MSFARPASKVLALIIGTGFGGVMLQCAAGNDELGDNTLSGGVGGSGNSGGSSSGGTSSGGSSAFGGTGASGNDATINFDGQIQDYSAESFFLDDPPPGVCDGGGLPPTPTGTPECPDDKHLEGCPCTTEGEKVACWPGYRKHRNHGACKDGETTCIKGGESTLKWGPCEGYQGIDKTTYMPLGTSGKAACGCFSAGYWKLENTSPCFSCQNAECTSVAGSNSTVVQGYTEAGIADAACYSPFTLPPDPWSKNTVKADCTGYFKLCYTLKAYAAPFKNGEAGAQASDCVMKQVCTEAHYDVENVEQSFPDLQAWITDTVDEINCSQAFVTNGGYAEMSVDGQSDECEGVNKVFQHVDYCPLKCNDPAHATDPECINCSNGGGGPF